MTLTPKEAIRRLGTLKGVRNIVNGFFDDDLQAIQLGIEALKFFKDLEDRGALPSGVRLPGETEK